MATNKEATIEVLLSYNNVSDVSYVFIPRLYNEHPRPVEIIINGVS
jgi:hypothetical protein